MPLLEMVETNEFRQDLLYRINTVEIDLPPLRNRVEDIPLLATHFIEMYAKKYRKDVKGIQEGAVEKLQKYTWPGNVRELQHAIERAIIMSEEEELTTMDFFFLSGSHSNSSAPDSFNLEEVERSVIEKVLERHNGNISKAAKELGLTRASLYRRLEKYGL